MVATARNKTKKRSVPEKAHQQPLSRLDLFDRFEVLERELEEFWDQPRSLFSRPFFRPLSRWHRRSHRVPAVDLYQEQNDLVLKADLPGLKKQDLEVRFENGDLIIQGERETKIEQREEDSYRLERSQGSFYRRLSMPFPVDTEQIEAKFQDGVLEIRIPKPAEEKPEAQKVGIH
jgi:HSP20 family protein